MDAPAPASCPRCGGTLRRVYGRVAVKFSGWGFRRTDSMVPDDRPRKDYRTLADRAEEIAEG